MAMCGGESAAGDRGDLGHHSRPSAVLAAKWAGDDLLILSSGFPATPTSLRVTHTFCFRALPQLVIKGSVACCTAIKEFTIRGSA